MVKGQSSREKEVWSKLQEILDPELYIPLTDMGLIYSVSEKSGVVEITMTLTTIGCPLYSLIEQQVIEKVQELTWVKKVIPNLVFDPPWSMEMLSDDARVKLGIV